MFKLDSHIESDILLSTIDIEPKRTKNLYGNLTGAFIRDGWIRNVIVVRARPTV